MFALFNNALIQIVLALTFSVPGISVLLQGASFDQVEAQYSQAIQDRVRILEQIQSLEGRHNGLTARIAALKQQDVSRLTVRLALDDLLRQSQELSRDLDGLQNKIRTIDNRLSGQRTQLVGGIDKRMMELERSLASARTKERQSIVGELNGLRAQRRTYAMPLPSVPSSGQVKDALSLATQAETPDELLAAADEIEDTEDQIRRRLDAIEGRLGDLKQSQRLLRRADTFSKEERFFEETDRDRVIARYSRTRVTRSDTDKSGGDNTATSDDASNANNAFEGGNNQASDDFAGAMNDFEAAPATDGARNDADVIAEPAADPTPVPDEVFETVEETVIINTNDDPGRAIGSQNRLQGSSSMEAQIESLTAEKSRLQKQASTLKRRAQDLRNRAQNP